MKPPDGGLRARDWRVDTCSHEQAQTLVAREHYARGSLKSFVYRHGLYRVEEWPMIVRGCALWIPPTRTAALASFRDLDPDRVLVLHRLAVEADVPTNGASFLMGRSIRLIEEDGRFDGLVTYADERVGHTGAIYRATNWRYVGLTDPEPVFLIGGRQVAKKTGSGTRTHAQMLELGATINGRSRKHKFVLQLRSAA